MTQNVLQDSVENCEIKMQVLQQFVKIFASDSYVGGLYPYTFLTDFTWVFYLPSLFYIISSNILTLFVAFQNSKQFFIFPTSFPGSPLFLSRERGVFFFRFSWCCIKSLNTFKTLPFGTRCFEKRETKVSVNGFKMKCKFIHSPLRTQMFLINYILIV